MSQSHGVGRTDDEAQPAGAQALLDEPSRPCSTMGISPWQPVDLGGVDVGAHHLVAEVGEARPGRESDVARPDDGDPRHARSYRD